jgi:sugar phosphate isomerase/epimerase
MPHPSIWTGLYGSHPTVTALRLLQAAGWEWFELSCEHVARIDQDPQREARIAEVRQACEDLGVHMPQAHAYLMGNVAQADAEKRASDVARFLREFECCAALGVKDVVLHPGTADGYDTPAERDALLRLNREQFTRLGDRAGELGLRLAIENTMDAHAKKQRNFGSAWEDLLELLTDLQHPALGITFDSSHANGQDVPGADMIRRYGAHLFCTHLSDNHGKSDEHLVPGAGTIDWVGIATALRDIGYQGMVNLEIPGEVHAVPELLELKSRHARAVAGWLTETATA